MKLWRTLIAAYAASAMLLALVSLTVAHAQEADESEIDAAKKPPPITQVAGTWTGTDSVNDGGQGTGSGPMILDLTQNQKKIAGTFSITSGNETPAGSVAGKITNDILTLTAHTTSGSKDNCTTAVVATVDGDTMSGTFLTHGGKNCNARGTFDLQRQ
ncbi:MAG: hypothetical protein ACLQAT_14085 [Candidatus Binataceae bacterium]